MKLKLNRSIIAVSVVIFCFAELSGCGFTSEKSSNKDDPSQQVVDFDASKIPDAVPKVESYYSSSNKSYVIRGHRYRVLRSAKGYHVRGIASWYGPRFNGKLTATQEQFNLYKMTAASPVLPLPTYVRVTNLANGKQIIVKVNDRGPYYNHRILDLSYAAAKKLGFAHKGITHVDVMAIDSKRWLASSEYREKLHQNVKFAQNNHTKKFYLRVGEFTKLNNAKHLSHRIAMLTNSPTKIHLITSHKNHHLYRVQVGPILSDKQSYALLQKLKSHGFKPTKIAV